MLIFLFDMIVNGNALYKSTYERIFLFSHLKNWFWFLRNFPYKLLWALAKSILKNLRQIASENMNSLAGLIPLAIFPGNSFLLDMCMSDGSSSKNFSLVLISEYIQDEGEWGSSRSDQYPLALSLSLPYFLSCLLGIHFKACI